MRTDNIVVSARHELLVCVCESKYELLIFIHSGNNILYCTLMTMTTMCPIDVNIDKIRFVRGQIIVRTSYTFEVIRSKMFRIHFAPHKIGYRLPYDTLLCHRDVCALVLHSHQ